MKKLLFIAFLLVGAATASHAQVLVSVGADVIKSDFIGFGGKLQAGAEANYFFTKSFSASAGFEFWSAGSPSVMLGVRYYPVEPVFLRMRGLVGENEAAFGIGYYIGLNERLGAEFIGDYYLVGNDAGLRAALTYRFSVK